MRNVGGWESNASLDRHLRSMNEKGWIVWDDSRETGSWVAKLTQAGKNLLKDHSLRESPWSESWDGVWRMLTFDLPQEARDQRHQLKIWLKERRFGGLQGSVWITPHPCEHWLPKLLKIKIDPRAVVIMEGRPIGNLKDSDLVKKAWDFDKINGLYRDYLRFLSSSGVQRGEEASLEKQFASWYAEEAELWRAAYELDPLLPDALCPKGYMGRKAFESRKQALANWGDLAPRA